MKFNDECRVGSFGSMTQRASRFFGERNWDRDGLRFVRAVRGDVI